MRNSRRMYLIGFVAALLIVFAARTFYYYRGIYSPPDVPRSEYTGVEVLSDDFQAVANVAGQGRTVVIDVGHDNAFDPEELTVFTGRLATNGGAVVYAEDLRDSLRGADTLVVIAPGFDYDAEEQFAIQQFVDKGGRMILIGEPTRGDIDALNSIASAFGVIYQDDYLYSLTRGDGNFRNVILNDFEGDSPLTAGLDEVVFEVAYSLRVPDSDGIILGDEEIYSSSREVPGGVIAASLTGGGQVVSLPDVTFLTSPYNTFADNDTLLDNLVIFALTTDRGYSVSDFPFYFDSVVQIVYENAVTLNNTFADMVALRSAVTGSGVPANLVEVAEQDAGQSYVYMALYGETNEEVLALLASHGVVVSGDPLSDARGAPDSDGSIQVEGVARLERGGTVMFHLLGPEPAAEEDSDSAEETSDEDTADEEAAGDEGAGEEVGPPPYQLIMLAAGEDDLSVGVELLLSGDLSDCMITATTAVCVTSEVEIGESGGTDEEAEPADSQTILVVSDDQGIAAFEDSSTSADAIAEALSDLDHDVDVVSLLDDDLPELGDLVAYDIVFWSAGDYCCSAPTEEASQVIVEYLDAGGRVVIDGIFIATDLDGTNILEDYFGAEFVDFSEQVDVAVSDEDHPLAFGLDEVMPLTYSEDEIPQPDVITDVNGAEVVLERGPDSSDAGAPSLVAYDPDDWRSIYAAFSLYRLPEDMLSQLLDNMVRWLTS